MSYRKILSIDPSTECGFAIGAPRTPPRFGTFRARLKEDHMLTTVATTLGELSEMWELHDNRADIMVFERPMEPGSHKGAAAGMIAYMVCAALIAWCRARQISCFMVQPATWRKSVIGTSKAPPDVPKDKSREWLKEAVLRQLIMEGALPKGCRNNNIGDAVGLFKYAEQRYCGVIPANLVMFGEEARVE